MKAGTRKRTCDKCSELDRCKIGALGKSACGDYSADPFRLERREARFTYRVRDPVDGGSPGETRDVPDGNG